MAEQHNIARRDCGDRTLVCEGCGRFWGYDDLKIHKTDDTTPLVGLCPMCNGNVYPYDSLREKKPEE